MPLFGRKKNDEALRHVPEVAVLPEPPAPGPDGLRTLEQHRDYLLGCVDELMPFGQHVLDALGLSICEDVVSGIDLPRFDNSAMDGYAVRAQDIAQATTDQPVTLPVVGEISAGSSRPFAISAGTSSHSNRHAAKIGTKSSSRPGLFQSFIGAPSRLNSATQFTSWLPWSSTSSATG